MAKKTKKKKTAKKKSARKSPKKKKGGSKKKKTAKKKAKKKSPKKKKPAAKKKKAKAKKAAKKKKVKAAKRKLTKAEKKFRAVKRSQKEIEKALAKHQRAEKKDQREIDRLHDKLRKAHAMAAEAKGKKKPKRKKSKAKKKKKGKKKKGKKKKSKKGKKRNPIAASNPIGSKSGGGAWEFVAGLAGVTTGGVLALLADRTGSTAALTNSSGTLTDNAGAVGGTYNSQGPSAPIWSSWKRIAYDAAAVVVPLGISAAIPEKHPNLKTYMQLTFFGALTITTVKLVGDLAAKLLGSTSYGARVFAPESAAVSQIASNGNGGSLSALTLSAQSGKSQAASGTAMLSGAVNGAGITLTPTTQGGIPTSPSAGQALSNTVAVQGPGALPPPPPPRNGGAAPPTPIATGNFPPPANVGDGSYALPQCIECGSYVCPGADPGGSCDVANYDPLNPTGETHPSLASPDQSTT